jgi:hypothetical protein
MSHQIAASKDGAATAFKANATWIAVCTASPGVGPAVSNEATGGSYARVQTTWGTVTAGVVSGSAVTVNLPVGTFTHIAICTAATGSTLYDWYPLGTSIVMSIAGTVTITPTDTEV